MSIFSCASSSFDFSDVSFKNQGAKTDLASLFLALEATSKIAKGNEVLDVFVL